MNIEEIILKRLKSENEYLEQIYFKHLKKTCKKDEEVENADGIIKEIRGVSSDIK